MGFYFAETLGKQLVEPVPSIAGYLASNGK
jgi:hypothetical protein